MERELTDHQSKCRMRTRWTPPLDKVFADLVVEQIRLGNRPNDIFDKKTWGQIRDDFNKKTSLNFNNNQLRKHLDVLRARYNQLKSGLIQNDFTLEDSCIGFDLWDGIGVNPTLEPVKVKDCPIYEQLCAIFADEGADGRYAQSSHYEEVGKSNLNGATGFASSLQNETRGPNADVPSLLRPVEHNVGYTGKPNVGSTGKVAKSASYGKRKRSLDADSNDQSEKDEETLSSMAEALLDMIAASKLRTNVKASSEGEFTITNCIKALDEMDGLNNSLYFMAVDLFADHNMRETFLSLTSKEKRYRWLDLESNCSSLNGF